MKKLEQALEIVRNAENEIQSGNYHQFTIDFVQNWECRLNVIGEPELDEQVAHDLVGALLYDLETTLEIIGDLKDRKVFLDIETALKIEEGNEEPSF